MFGYHVGTMETMTWQASLLDAAFGNGPTVAWPPSLEALERHDLDGDAWVDHAPQWLPGADAWFDRLVRGLEWEQRWERIQGERIAQPRLTDHRRVEDLDGELEPLGDIAAALTRHYGVCFERLGSNLYRDGRDSVAWHGDRIARDRPTALIAIVSLGEPRRFRLRPRAGGAGVGFDLGHGDLLVMGGSCQRTWQHAVPKVARAGPRISLTFRHAYPPTPA
jgi:alkylated DNA repair dioxygenase AlkB